VRIAREYIKMIMQGGGINDLKLTENEKEGSQLAQ